MAISQAFAQISSPCTKTQFSFIKIWIRFVRTVVNLKDPDLTGDLFAGNLILFLCLNTVTGSVTEVRCFAKACEMPNDFNKQGHFTLV